MNKMFPAPNPKRVHFFKDTVLEICAFTESMITAGSFFNVPILMIMWLKLR